MKFSKHRGKLRLLLSLIIAAVQSISALLSAQPKPDYQRSGHSAGGIIHTDSEKTLRQALENANPGDSIIVGGGIYNANFTLRKSGNEMEPILVCAEAGQKVLMVGSFTLEGNYGVLEGFEFTGRGRIEITGDHNRITNNYIYNFFNTAIAVTHGGSHNRIDHNEIAYMNQIAPDHPRGIFIRYRPEYNKIPVGNRIDHNYLRDFPNRGGNGYEPMQIGEARGNHLHLETLIEFNLLENTNSDGEIISIKSSGNRLIGNTFIHSPYYVQNRMGSDSLWQNNWFEGVDLRILGKGIQVIGNTFVDGVLYLQVGNTTQEELSEKAAEGNARPPNRPVTKNALVVGNTVDNKIIVGHNNVGSGAIAVKDSRLEANIADEIVLGLEKGTTVLHETTIGYGRAQKLESGDVGRSALKP